VILREVSAILRGRDPIQHSLSSTVDALIDTIMEENGALYNIASYIEHTERGNDKNMMMGWTTMQ